MICKKCNKTFPVSQIIDGKRRILNKRKYCLDCSPFYKHNTKKLDSDLKVNNPVPCVCSICNRKYLYTRLTGHTLKLCNSCQVNRRRVINKLKAIDYLGGKCSCCGYNRSKNALDIHHNDPSKKEFNFSNGRLKSWEVLKQELDKCTLFCSNCHREFHDPLCNKNLPS